MSAAALRWYRHRPEGLGETPSYGARELQRLHARHLLQALTLSCLLGVAAALVLSQISHLWGGRLLEEPKGPDEERRVDFSPVPVPPRTPPPPQPPAVSDRGIPVAVPDAAADTSLVLATESDFPFEPFDPRGPAGPPGSQPGGTPGTAKEELPDPEDFVYAEEMPIEITRVTPEYPDIARRAGMEGRVLVRALVGVDGRVRDVRIQSAESVFDEEAAQAVRRWVFRPAQLNRRPVAVWVSVPITFRLR